MALNSSSLNCGKLLRSVFTVAIIGGVLASAAVGDAQTTTTLNASKDNTLYEDTGGQISNGQGIYLFTGRTAPRGGSELRRGLIAFDLRSIPANATVKEVTLVMFNSSPSAAAVNISLHKVSRDWGEGASNAGSPGGTGTQAQANDATWLHNLFNTSRWAAAGGDFSGSSSETTAINGTNRTYTWSGAGLVRDVQSWITDPGANFGWAIIGDEATAGNAQRFNTRENTSSPPRLTVIFDLATPTPTPTPAQLLNISTRLRVEPGDDALIGGFIVAGSQPKRVILRAIGPSLTQRNVSDVLADPVLELRAPDGSIIMTNDNWRENQQADIQNSGVAPENDLEAAIVATLPAGNNGYTAVVRGKNNTTGVGLIEAYDLDRAADSRLANISTRGLVQTGTNVMIGGFIVGGEGNARVILRAIGPSLTQSGVANALADPTLQLVDENGSLLESNDNWRTDPDQAEIAAAGVAPQNDLESALLASIPPGSYTAIVAGNNSGTGVGLIEAYHLR